MTTLDATLLVIWAIPALTIGALAIRTFQFERGLQNSPSWDLFAVETDTEVLYPGGNPNLSVRSMPASSVPVEGSSPKRPEFLRRATLHLN